MSAAASAKARLVEAEEEGKGRIASGKFRFSPRVDDSFPWDYRLAGRHHKLRLPEVG